MAARVIAQLIITGTTVVARAVFTAYQQALNNAKRGGAANATARMVKNKMNPDEAMKILNIEKTALNPKLLEQQYSKYYASNDPKKGGSFYLQSKIFRAKEALDKELNGGAETSNAEPDDGKEKEKRNSS